MPQSRIADNRLIEDYLPFEEISAESRREKSVQRAHILSTLHLHWACRNSSPVPGRALEHVTLEVRSVSHIGLLAEALAQFAEDSECPNHFTFGQNAINSVQL